MKTIREQMDVIYNKRNELDAQIDEVRSICKHKKTKEVDFSYRVGATIPAIVCVDCDEFIKSLL